MQKQRGSCERKVSELITFARCLPWGKTCGGLPAPYITADLTVTREEGEKNHHLKMKNTRVEETCQDHIALGGGDKLKPVFILTLLHIPLALGVGLHESQFHHKAIKLYEVPS